MIENQVLLITGGTGSFGNAVVKRFLSTDIKEIRIFSRDEKKQDDMRGFYNDKRLKFYLGDVRSYGSINDAMIGVHYVFHAAALKQVPSCEFYPLEAYKTNVVGTSNVIEAAIKNQVRKVIALSTDKAVYPVNAMGISKAMMEKLILSKARHLSQSSTTACITRYGNVIASRGSVVPLFIKQIKSGIPVTITDPKMSRFLMSLDDAVDLVLYAFKNGKNGDIFVHKAPAATIHNLATALMSLMGKVDHPVKIIGIRHGEKSYETLLSREEMFKAVDLGEYYKVPSNLRDLNYNKYLVNGMDLSTETSEYNSNNTYKLNQSELIKILANISSIKSDEQIQDIFEVA